VAVVVAAVNFLAMLAYNLAVLVVVVMVAQALE